MTELIPVEYNPFKKSTTPDDFSARYGAAAEKAAKALGVDPKVVLGQWGLETGWGKSVIPGTNNLGNIKDFSGKGIAATDNMNGSRDKYRAYESPDQFVDDYVSLIQRKYPDAVNAKTPEDFAKALKSGGYAEDPGYVAKVTTAAKMTPVKATTGPELVPVDFDPFAPKTDGGATGSWEEKEKPGMIASLGAGLGKGTGAVALGAQDLVGRGINAVSSEGTPGAKLGQWLRSDAQAGREKLAAENAPYKAANPITNATGEIGGNVLATLPVGAGLGTLATKAGAPALGAAIASGGMRTGVEAAPGALGAIANMGTRMAGGAIAGGASAGLVDADSATTGAAIGAALPPVVKGLGAAGSALARTIRGPAAPESVRVAAEAARQAGYVIPPTQVKPSLGNRLLEGMSGKITTAQNASARNQEVTNRLAQRAIGAAELSPEGLQAVRNQANGAYSALGKAGEFSADDAFRQALQKVGAPSSKLKQDFPALANKELEGIVDSFSSTKNFDAQSAIEAIKELRAAQRAGIKSMDPATVAMARAKGKISDALEDLVERNLTAKGDEGLLTAYREARQTLAKVYDVEKALNPATGNVDAKKLGNLLKKGRLTGDLKTAGEFAASFPKAAQTMENMGSLPQTSPLDWSAGLMASAASGSPLGMVGVAARPAARAMTLSPFVQNRLAQTQALPMLTQNAQRNLLQPLYRAGPVLSSDR